MDIDTVLLFTLALGAIGAVFGLIGLIIGLLALLRPRDTDKIAAAAAILVEPLREELECAKAEAIKDREQAIQDRQKITRLETALREYHDEIEYWREWAGRLISQVKSHDLTPVKPRPRPAGYVTPLPTEPPAPHVKKEWLP